jgi:hypothetical protein
LEFFGDLLREFNGKHRCQHFRCFSFALWSSERLPSSGLDWAGDSLIHPYNEAMFRLNFFASAPKSDPKTPKSFILPLAEPVTVTRSDDDFLHLQWQEVAGRTVIYVGSTPHDVAKMSPVVTVGSAREAMVAGLNTAVRHYFRLEFQGGAWDGRALIAAERVLPLQKGVNLRDVGGYYTKDGQMVRWGQLYRSGSLSRLTQADLAYLQRLNIKLVSDLRTVSERLKQPDKLPDVPGLVERPLPMESVDRWERMRGAFTVFFRKGRIGRSSQNQGCTSMSVFARFAHSASLNGWKQC